MRNLILATLLAAAASAACAQAAGLSARGGGSRFAALRITLTIPARVDLAGARGEIASNLGESANCTIQLGEGDPLPPNLQLAGMPCRIERVSRQQVDAGEFRGVMIAL